MEILRLSGSSLMGFWRADYCIGLTPGYEIRGSGGRGIGVTRVRRRQLLDYSRRYISTNYDGLYTPSPCLLRKVYMRCHSRLKSIKYQRRQILQRPGKLISYTLPPLLHPRSTFHICPSAGSQRLKNYKDTVSSYSFVCWSMLL